MKPTCYVKKYIGKTLRNNWHLRINEHTARKSDCYHLHRALTKYGDTTFKIDVLYQTSIMDNTFENKLILNKELSEAEIECIKLFNTTDPKVSLADTKDFDSYKLYIADTGLFVTLMFIDRPATENEIYAKLLSDKLPINLGYLYENLMAQMIAASGRELYYHTWNKKGSSHYYEVDFIVSDGSKINVFEVKSSGIGKHESINEFCKKYSNIVNKSYLISQKDIGKEKSLLFRPFYLVCFLVQ